MIEEYFKSYIDKHDLMQEALKELVDAKQSFYSLTGISYDDMPKGNKKPLGLDDLLGNIEHLEEEYIARKREYEEEKEKYKKEIDGLEELSKIHKAIIKYAYLDFESNKTITDSLKKYHNKDYSLGYVKILKSNATNKFRKLITKYNLI